MILLTAFLLTIAYYAVLIGLNQKSKKQFVLSQQIVLPTMEQLSNGLTTTVGQSEPKPIAANDSVFGALNVNTDLSADISAERIIESNIPNSTSIAIDHLVHTDSYKDSKPKIDIPKINTVAIADNEPKTALNTLKIS